MWFYPSNIPEESYALFSAFSSATTGYTQPLLRLSLLPDGKISIFSNAAPNDVPIFSSSRLKKSRWTHVSFVWYPKKGSHPNLSTHSQLQPSSHTHLSLGLYVDGAFAEGTNLSYPRMDSTTGTNTGVRYAIGNVVATPAQGLSWCLASAHLLATPLRKPLHTSGTLLV